MDRLQRISFRRSRSNTDVGKFHMHVEEISKLLDELSNVVEAIKRMQSGVLEMPMPLNDNRKQDLNELHVKVKLISAKVRSKLDSISRKIKDFEKEQVAHANPQETITKLTGDHYYDSAEPGLTSFSTESKPPKSESKYVPAIQRVRKTQYSVLLKRYVDLMAEYHQVQIDHRHRVKRRLIRQMEIMNLPYTEEEIDTMIEEGSLTGFTMSSIVTDTQIARQNIEDITERQNDILKLEKSIRELNELFKELAWLVNNQGGLIDKIETNIASAADFVDSGKNKTKKACKIKTWSRKKKAYLYTLGGSGTVVTLIIVVVLTCL